ncbi:MAG TPA: helix-turn-helix transcriptional regulator [Syntrophobacter fumaroxidans]|nr:helix-turn-helix transcriptional regulator [Syntrophobacter fumaroxidans]
MRTFRDHLQEKLQDKWFGELFDEEKELVRIGIEVAEARAKLGMSQADLAKRACVTQQQVSKVENGANCNVLTLLKVCRALSLRCRLNASA